MLRTFKHEGAIYHANKNFVKRKDKGEGVTVLN